MTRCLYGECGEAIEGTFYLAPGSHESHPWPVSVPYLREPVPLCKWHGLLVGDQPARESERERRAYPLRSSAAGCPARPEPAS